MDTVARYNIFFAFALHHTFAKLLFLAVLFFGLDVSQMQAQNYLAEPPPCILTFTFSLSCKHIVGTILVVAQSKSSSSTPDWQAAGNVCKMFACHLQPAGSTGAAFK